MSRYLAVAGAALLLLVLLVVGGLALKSALTTKSQPHPTSTSTHAAGAPDAPGRAAVS